MNAIENFAELPFDEQKKFAEALIKTINSENIFTDATNFKVSGVETDELSGGLIITLEHDDPISVSRKATWTCANEDELDADPGYDADYANYLFEDAKKAFKTLSAEIEGYKISLDIEDVDEEETVEVEVNSYSHEDSGIGEYDYWGHIGYDSQPYIEVEGTIVTDCTCSLTLYVEPSDEKDNSSEGAIDAEEHFED